MKRLDSQCSTATADWRLDLHGQKHEKEKGLEHAGAVRGEHTIGTAFHTILGGTLVSSWSSKEVSRPARGGILASQKWTLPLLLLAGLVAVSLQGHGGRVLTALLPLQALVGSRECDRTKPRTSD